MVWRMAADEIAAMPDSERPLVDSIELAIQSRAGESI
jgi:hypothetical protein